MRARPNGGLFVLCLDNVSGTAKKVLSTILTQAKFVQAIPMTGMAGNILPMAAPGLPALRFKRILDQATIQDFAELNCVSYDRSARYRGWISAVSASWIPPDGGVHGMHARVVGPKPRRVGNQPGLSRSGNYHSQGI